MTRKQADIYLRAFGMPGVQARIDLDDIEKEYHVSLLPEAKRQKVRKLEGYDQFEGGIRAQASEMSEYYEIFYCLEISIRQLVENTLKDAEDVNWWNTTRVPPDFRSYVAGLKADEANSVITPRSDNELDYLTFGQLGKLITNNFDVFNSVLSSKRAVDRIMTQLNLLRNPIAHCCILADDEKERLELTVRDWFRVRS